ncbi:MAG: YaiO family outer membrane beta-barrel protein [Gemmatimonadales bacterium]
MPAPPTPASRLFAIVLALVVCNDPSPVIAQLPTETGATLRLRAEALRQEQRLDEALDLYQALVTSDSHNFDDRFWVAKLTGWTGRPAAAESLFTALLQGRPEDYDSRIGLIDVRIRLKHYAAAQADLEVLGRAHIDDPEVLFRHGRVCEAVGNRHQARRYFEQVLATKPDHEESAEALRRLAVDPRWASGIEYYGEQISHTAATSGATASLQARPSDRLRWRAAASLQQKFTQTEVRVGGELTHGLFGATELRWSAYVAPGAEVLPRRTYGLGVARKVGQRLVLYGDYTLLDFESADVHRAGSGLELYAGRQWIFAGHYTFASTHVPGAGGAVSNHAASVSVGYLYGGTNVLRVSGAAGGESFALPSIDAIGEFSAHTIGIDWRQFVSPWLGLALFYAYQDRSDGVKQHSYGLGLVRRW